MVLFVCQESPKQPEDIQQHIEVYTLITSKSSLEVPKVQQCCYIRLENVFLVSVYNVFLTSVF